MCAVSIDSRGTLCLHSCETATCLSRCKPGPCGTFSSPGMSSRCAPLPAQKQLLVAVGLASMRRASPCIYHESAAAMSPIQVCVRETLGACTHARVCLGCAPDIFPLVLGHFQGGQDADASTLSLLPPGLRTEGLKHLHASAFVTVPMFKHTGKYDAFWRSLLERAEVRPSTLYIGLL